MPGIETTEVAGARETPSLAVLERFRMSAARRTIGQAMVRSMQQAPHFYVSKEVDMSQVEATRSALQAAGQTVPSFNDFFVGAAARALRAWPRINSTLDGDQVTVFEDINVGMVTSLGDRVLVPVIKGADRLDVREIARLSKDLVARARAKKLLPFDCEGGTFSVSNLGMFGVSHFTAIINPGQAAILAVGEVTPRVVARAQSVAVRPMATMTLSVDHRIADGVMAAKYLESINETLQSPDLRRS